MKENRFEEDSVMDWNVKEARADAKQRRNQKCGLKVKNSLARK